MDVRIINTPKEFERIPKKPIDSRRIPKKLHLGNVMMLWDTKMVPGTKSKVEIGVKGLK